MEPWLIIAIHQIVFQGMFALKNITLSKKLGINIRGKNPEATLSTIIFALFIITSLAISSIAPTLGQIELASSNTAMIIGLTLAVLSTLISAAALISLKDSWRVGVIENQRTKLITTGIYKFSRNPYFLSYSLMFFSYTILLQNIILLSLSIICLFLINMLVVKEETHLFSVHGEEYLEYKNSTPRYLWLHHS